MHQRKFVGSVFVWLPSEEAHFKEALLLIDKGRGQSSASKDEVGADHLYLPNRSTTQAFSMISLVILYKLHDSRRLKEHRQFQLPNLQIENSLNFLFSQLSFLRNITLLNSIQKKISFHPTWISQRLSLRSPSSCLSPDVRLLSSVELCAQIPTTNLSK